MTAEDRSGAPRDRERVRLVYHYRDGRDVVTGTMLRAEAVAYMPLLHAVRVDDSRYEAAFATIEVRGA